MAWNPKFWGEHQVSYHFGKPWPYPLLGLIPNWAPSLNQWEIGHTKMKNFTTKLLCFNTYENLVLTNVHLEHYVDANKKKKYQQSARAVQREQSQQGLGFQPSPSRWVFREFAATQNRHVQQCSHTQKIDTIHLVELSPSIFSKWRLWHFKMAIIEDMATKLARIIWT